MNGLTLPLQNLTEMVRLTFADHYLKSVTEGNEPTLAAEGAQLANMADIDQGVAVNSLKLAGWQTFFDPAQRLGGQQALLGGDNPYQFTFRLKCQNLVRIEEYVVIAVPAYNLAARGGFGWARRRGDGSRLVGNLQGLMAETTGSFYRLFQARVLHWLQQIVNGARLERLNGVLVEGSHNDDDRYCPPSEVAHHLKAAHHRHLEIEEDQLRPEFLDLFQRRPTVVGLSDQFDVGKQFKSLSEHLPGDRFIIDD